MSAKEGGEDEDLQKLKHLGLINLLMKKMDKHVGFSDRLFVESIVGSGCKSVAELRGKLPDNLTLKIPENVLAKMLNCMQDYQSDSRLPIHFQGRGMSAKEGVAMSAKEGGEDKDHQKLKQLVLINTLMKVMDNQLGFSDILFVKSIIGSGCKSVAELRGKLPDNLTLKIPENVLGEMLNCMQDYQSNSRSPIHCQGRAMSAKEGGEDEDLQKLKQPGLINTLMKEMENQLGFSDILFVKSIIGSGCKSVAELRGKLSDNITLKIPENVLGQMLNCMQDYQSDSRSPIHFQGRAMSAKEGGDDEDLQKLKQLGLINLLMKKMDKHLGFSDRLFVESIIGSGCKSVAELRGKLSDNVTLKMPDNVTLKMPDNVLGELFKCMQDFQPDSPRTEPRLFGVYKGKVVKVLDDICKVRLVDSRKKGWLYKAEMARRKIENARDVVEPGQEICVKVISTLGGKLVLSMRDVDQEHGRDLLPLNRERYEKDRAIASSVVPGQPELFRIYKGKVGRVTENYCFVRLLDFRGNEGLLRKSEMARWMVADAREIVKPGQLVFVKVILNLAKS